MNVSPPRKGRFIAVALLLAVGVVVFFMERETNKPTQPPLPAGTPREGGAAKGSYGVKLEGMEYTEVAEGKTRWTVSAKLVEFLQDEKKSLLTDVFVRFFLSDGTVITLTAEKGILHAGTKDIEISHNVVVTLPNGTTLKTEKVNYMNEKKELHSTVPLVVSGQGFAGSIAMWRYSFGEGKAYGEGGVTIEWEPTVLSLNRPIPRNERSGGKRP